MSAEVAGAAAPRRWRVAVVSSHAIQYQVPLWRELSAAPDIDLTVYLCSSWGAEEYLDREFGRQVKWDVPLLSGYRYRLLRNWSRSRAGAASFLGLVNPGLVGELVRERYDAVLIPGYAVASYWLAYLGAWLSRTPVFFRGETVLRLERPFWVRAAKRLLLTPLFRGTAAFLTIGTPSREFYQAWGVPEDRMFETPYTVDNAFFMAEARRWAPERAALRTELGLDADRPTFLFVGKLVERKRPADLLAAYAAVKRAAQVVFVGDGPLRAQLEERARLQALSGAVFAGFRNQSKLPRFYALADALVLPSSHEVSPLVLNEAMCAGLALVVSDAVPSTRDLVENGKNGFCYPCGDVAALARILDRLTAEPGLLHGLGASSRERITGWSHAEVLAGLRAALRSRGGRSR